MTGTLRVGVIGASGYTGGELLRLLADHPSVEVAYATSDRLAGKRVVVANPNLRKHPRVGDLKFVPHADAAPCDVLFVCTPHGHAMDRMPQYLELAPRVIDLSADHRLANAADYPRWYGREHPHPELLRERAYGIPELHRKEIRDARLVSGAGCIATAAILALHPLLKHGLVDPQRIVVDAKIGSSAAGAEPDPSTHHPERVGVVRAYAPTGHRHVAEMEQELAFGARPRIGFTAHAVELVRGISATCHLEGTRDLDTKEVWKAYRAEYGEEPFVRIVRESSGVYRLPEPKVVAGTNFCDVGFEVAEDRRRLVVVSAIDNLVKGAAGAAVQNMNVAFGFPEEAGLAFAGLHP